MVCLNVPSYLTKLFTRSGMYTFISVCTYKTQLLATDLLFYWNYVSYKNIIIAVTANITINIIIITIIL